MDPNRLPGVSRTLRIIEQADGDALVCDDRYNPRTGDRTSRAVYHTSSLPPGSPHPADAYHLTERLPALLAVDPDCETAVTILRCTTGDYRVTIWRSTPGSTDAHPIGSSTTNSAQVAADRARAALSY